MTTIRSLPILRITFLTGFILALLFALYTNRVWEDYYITFRSSKNLAMGNGLVYNVGDRLHTFTSPLGVLIPAACSFVTGNSSDTAALWLFRGICAAAFGGAITLLVILMRKLAWPAIATALLAVMLLTDAKSLDFTINGMETAFMLLFMAYALWAHFSPRPRQWQHLGAAWAGLMWTRPDSFIYVGLMAAGCWLFNQPDRTGGDRRHQLLLFLKAGLLTTAIYGPWLIWAGWYYGSPIPHTIVAKAAMTGEGAALQEFLHGIWQLPYMIWRGDTAAEGSFLPAYYMFPSWPSWSLPFGRILGIIAAMLWLIPRLRLECRIASFAYFVAISYLSFVPYFPFPWYLPATTLLAWVALAGTIGQLWQSNRSSLHWIVGVSSVAVICGGLFLTVAASRQAKAQQFYVEDGNRRLIGEWLKEHSEPGDTVFMEPLGYIGYFSGLKTYDWPGMSSREVPEAVKLVGNQWQDIILYLRPDWLVLRDNSQENLKALSSKLSQKYYERVRDFNRREDIEKLDIAGKDLLLFDSHFEIYRRRNPMHLIFRDKAISPESYTAQLGVNRVIYENREAIFTHAPSTFTFEQFPGMSKLTGEFGFLDEAWTKSQKTAGAIFEIEQIHDDKSTTLLFSKTLRPGKNFEDRSVQSFSVAVPTIPHAKLNFSIRPAHPLDNAFNYTFWHGIKAESFSTTIAHQEGAVTSIDSDATNGFATMEEEGQEVLFAHAPSRLDFLVPDGATLVTGKIGLLQRAYTGSGNTDGVRFIIESVDPDGQRTVLLNRLLQPYTVSTDQGAHDFYAVLPIQAGFKLILRTEPRDSSRLDYTWSYWKDLRFEHR